LKRQRHGATSFPGICLSRGGEAQWLRAGFLEARAGWPWRLWVKAAPSGDNRGEHQDSRLLT